VQATGGGVVTEINIRENSVVKSGDQLLVIQEQVRPLDNAQRHAFEQRRLDLEREYRKVASEYNNKIQQLEFDLANFTGTRETRTKQLEGQVSIIEKQLATARNAIKSAEGSRAIAARQYDAINKLFETHDVTLSQRDVALAELNSTQKTVFDARAREAETAIQLETVRAELHKYKGMQELDKIQRELEQRKTQRDRDLERLKEDIDGLVKRLNEAVTSEGITLIENKAKYSSIFDGLVTKIHAEKGQMIAPGAPLLSLVRESAALEAHALVDNKDIGHLKRGQEVKIKYFAYPYQEYGIAEGLIADIATIATPGIEEQASKYVVKIVLREETIAKPGGMPKPLQIGLEGIAEIKTGEKRFIELVFSPLSRFFSADGHAHGH
jgi:multidrug resistance efflux pump